MRAARFSTLALGLALCAAQARAQQPPSPAGRATGAVVLPTIDVVATTPLSGTGVDVDKLPAGVTIIDSSQIEQTRSPSVVKALAQQTPSVTINEVAGNPFQPDVAFRGFDASPVSGTPQGLAVYQNGVRINEAFGDIVNWDLIPTAAVRSIDVISNNPAFGLNALGGALSVQMKDGFGFQGTTIDVMGGSYGRLQSSLQWGKQVGDYAVYGALEAVRDNGYRNSSPSLIRRFYGDVGYKGDSSELHLNIGAADNAFGATATAPIELLDQSWSSVYTTPQTSHNQVGYVNATATVNATPTWTLQGAAHLRVFNQATVDGNSTDAAPCVVDPTLLCFNGARAGQQRRRPATRQSVRAGRDARRNRPHVDATRPASAQACRRPIPTPCGGMTIISSSAAASTTASPAFPPAPSSASSSPIISSRDQGCFSGPRAIRFRTVRSRCTRPISTAGSTRWTHST